MANERDRDELNRKGPGGEETRGMEDNELEDAEDEDLEVEEDDDESTA